MKTMRKLFAMALAIMLVMSLATTAFAAEGDIYEIYQVFTGDISEGVLSNVKWGQNGTGTTGEAVDGAVLNELTAVNNGTDAEQLAVIEKYATLSDPFKTGAADTYTLPNGYYLVRNVPDSQEGDYDFYTLHVVKVVDGTLAIVPKGDAPKVEKDVDKTDINIGDSVTFTLTATMPSTFEGYESYKVTFHDTMYKGLTFNENSVNVSVEGFNTTTGTDADGNTTITITNTNVLGKVQPSGTITVTYTATLNADAIIGVPGNFNKVKLEYSNNPNTGMEGETGFTPEDDEKVYTWDMGVLKYGDGDQTKVLEGVKFILLNEAKNEIAKVENGKIVSWDDYTAGQAVAEYELTTGADGKIAIAGLASGNYWLRETQELPGYNKLTADVAATVTGKTDGSYATYVAEINNQSGATLPETGGIGTTLFYVFGAILMVGAAVLLITKKRMASAE